MNMEIYEKVKLILEKRFKIDSALIVENANLENDLGLDSIELMDAVSLAEREFGVKIIPRGAVNLEFPPTVGALVDLIVSRTTEKV